MYLHCQPPIATSYPLQSSIGMWYVKQITNSSAFSGNILEDCRKTISHLEHQIHLALGLIGFMVPIFTFAKVWLNYTKVFSCRQQYSILDMWIDNLMFSLATFLRQHFIKVRFRAITRPFARRQSEAVRFGDVLTLRQFQPLPHHSAHSVEEIKLTMRHSLQSPNKMGLR